MSRPTRPPLSDRVSTTVPRRGLHRLPAVLSSGVPIRLWLSISLIGGVLAALPVISGCSMYQNVTGYFNTYYNARRLFDEATSDAALQSQKDRDTNYFAKYTVPQNVQDKFDKIIEKCSKLIQFYPQSKWVDDAILMIGESYVYLGEYESASRKFKELLDHFPTSDLRFETKLWDAEARYYLGQQDAALTVIKDLFPEARAEGKNDVLMIALMLQARIFTERSEFDQAAASYALAVEVPGDDALKANAEYLLGQSYEKSNDKVKAAEAYGKVRKFSPTPLLDFQARLRYGMMLSASGEHGRALRALDDLNQDVLTVDQHGLVDLEIANTYLAKGDTDQAYPLYNLIDTTYKHSEASAKSYYRRGLLYEEQNFDYKSARDYYNKAKTEFTAADVTPLASRRADNLDHYFVTFASLKRCRDLYTAALYRDSVTAAGPAPSPLGPGIATADTLPRRGGERTAVDSTIALRPAVPTDTSRKAFLPPDVIKEQLQPPKEEIAHGASETLRRRLSDRDLFRDDDEEVTVSTKSQRPEGQLRGAGLAAGGKKDSALSPAAGLPAASAQIPADSAAELLAACYFELGGIYYLELNRPDSAVDCYRMVADRLPPTPYVPRALYGLAEIASARHDSAEADSLHQIILTRYTESEYADQVRKIKGLQTTGLRSTDSTQAKYLEAEHLLQAGMTAEAMKLFKGIASTRRASPFKPKAAYAVGYLYETAILNNDSAAEWYRHLSSDYPNSVYAAEVRPKVAVHDDPEAVKQFVKAKTIEPVGPTPDSLRHRPATPAKQSAIDRIKERQREEELNQLDEQDSKDEDDSKQDDEDLPDPDDDNNN